MKAITVNANKLNYCEPQIKIIILDHEISLQLDSSPPAAPGEPGYVAKITPDYIINDPFKNNFS
jgi:hypothetical protein